MRLPIVILIYNVEDTPQRCLEGVLAQTDERIGVILIDDGSTDSSGKVAEEMTANKGNYGLIHQENKGLSTARGTGIEVATGDYLTFVDFGGFVAEGTYDTLLAALAAHPDCDILEYPAMLYYKSVTRQRLLTFTDTTIDSIRDCWLGRAYLHTYTCDKLFRHGLFTQTRFPEGKVFGDVCTYPYLLQQTRVVATTVAGLYYYCQNDKDITAQAGGKELNDLLEMHLKHLKL